jgi:hypothetical protein
MLAFDSISRPSDDFDTDQDENEPWSTNTVYNTSIQIPLRTSRGEPQELASKIRQSRGMSSTGAVL